MKSIIQKNSPAFIGIIAFIVFSMLTYKYIEFDKGLKEEDERNLLLELLILKKSELEKSLSSRIYHTKGVAAYVSLNPDIDSLEYQNLAKELIKNDTVISTMALAKDAVITSIYPKKGHEDAIGLDLLEHPKRRKIVKQTIETRKTFVAGPVELVEGGIAFISYTPIFNNTTSDTTEFWGMTDIVIKRDALFNEANLRIDDGTNLYALKGIDGSGNKGEVFWGERAIFNNNPVTIKIALPTGNWILASMPANGWNKYDNKSVFTNIILFSSSLVISILVWLLANAWRKIKNNESELKALFGAMNDLVIILDNKGYYRHIAPTNNHLLIRPANDMLNKSLYDFFDFDKAKFFHDAILESINEKKTVQIEYPLIINKKELWFTARISYISDNSVIYVAHDNTETILSKNNLMKSEKELKALNAMKDKFFSIIAHDLKNPIGAFKNSTELLYYNFSEFNEEDKFEFIENLKETSESLYSLLTNLLEWSRIQRGSIEPVLEQTNILFLINNTVSHLKTFANNKNISIENNIKNDTYCVCDPNMISTVFRNIISNAIKFTPESGLITINNFSNVSGNQKYQVFTITDTGIGISENRIDKLFKIDSTMSSPGTNNEKGTGLGLILCKDFLKINNGKIEVKSQIGKGTTFSIFIPENNL
jgi:signal transduction histidine kinase/sensor domain CHASE-containing protein